MNDSAENEDDGLEWLRAIRRKLSEDRQRNLAAWWQRMKEIEDNHPGGVLSVQDVAALRARLKAARAANEQSN